MAVIDNTEMENSEVVIVIKSIFLTLCVLLGVIGNLVVIIAITKNRKLQTVTNYFVLNLAITDLLFTICGIPTIIVTTIAKKWLLGYFLCDAIGFLNSLFCTTSIWTLVMISINRYFNVAKANEIKYLYTRKRTTIIIIGVWTFSVLISIPPLIGWSEFKSGSNFCTISGKKSSSYSIFIALVAYVVPMVFLASLYLRIFFMLHKHEKKKLRSNINIGEFSEPRGAKSLSFENVSVSSVHYQAIDQQLSFNDKKVLDYYSKYKIEDPLNKYNEEGLLMKNNLESQNPNTRENLQKIAIKKHFKEVRITKMLMLLVLSFFVCWTPVFLGSILYSFNLIPKRYQVATFGIMCACLNCILNPLIYSILNRSFRKYVIQMWKTVLLCLLCRNCRS